MDASTLDSAAMNIQMIIGSVVDSLSAMEIINGYSFFGRVTAIKKMAIIISIGKTRVKRTVSGWSIRRYASIGDAPVVQGSRGRPVSI